MRISGFSKKEDLQHKTTLFGFMEKILLFVFFLSCLSFKNYDFHLMVIVFGLYLLSNGVIYFQKGLIPVVMLSLSILFFWESSLSGPTGICRWLSLPLAYIVGYGLPSPRLRKGYDVESAEKKARFCLVLASLGFFGHYSLNMLYNRGNDDLGRNTLDFWTGEVRSATGQAALACMAVGLFIAVLFSQYRLRYKVLSAAGLLILAVYNLTLSTRTIYFMMLAIAFVAAFYFLKSGPDGEKKLKPLIFVGILVLLVLILYYQDAFGLKTLVEDSEFYKRFFGQYKQDISEDTRWDNKLVYIKLMPEYLWGGHNILDKTGGYAHDIFLDTYDELGVFGFVAIIALIFSSVVKLITLVKNKNLTFLTKQLFLCVYAALYIEFMFEPIFAGLPGLLLVFCFFHGMVSRLCLINQEQSSY